MKFILPGIITLLLLFATSFLLDIELVEQNVVRTIVIYLLLIAEFILGLKVTLYYYRN